MTANFHLIVDASQQLDQSVAPVAAFVPCVIKQILRLVAIRILDERPDFLRRRVDIAKTSEWRTNNDLSDLFDSALPIAVPDDVNLSLWKWSADWLWSRQTINWHAVKALDQRCFSRTIEINNLTVV